MLRMLNNYQERGGWLILTNFTMNNYITFM